MNRSVGEQLPSPVPPRATPVAGDIGTDPAVDHVWSNLRVFLTADPISDAVLLGDGRGIPALSHLADRAVSLEITVGGVARPSAPGPAADGSFDLVVVDADAHAGARLTARLAHARRLVAPRGRIVVTSSGLRRGRQIRRELGDAGVARYVALPNVRRPAVLIDRADDEPGRYFLRRVAFPYRAPGRTGARARLIQLRNRIGMACPPRITLAVAPHRVHVVSGPGSPRTVVQEIGAFLRSSWSSLGLPADPPERFSHLAIAHRKVPGAVVSVVFFGGAVPVVARVPRYGGPNAALHRESETLERVLAQVRGPIRDSLPRPLGSPAIAGTDVVLQTVVPGRHLVARTATRRLTRSRLRRQFETMFAWSTGLQEASGRWTVVDDELLERTLVPLSRAALDALGDDDAVRGLLDRAIDHARLLRGTPVRLAVVHGDYWAGNVLVDGARVTGVVDWERAEVAGLPVWDPFKAVMDAAYHLDRYRDVPRRGPAAMPGWGSLGPWEGIADARCATGVRAVLDGAGWFSHLAREALVQAFADAEIPVGWLPVVVPFHLVREFVHADASARSVDAWGSVLRALALHPLPWADDLIGDRRGSRRRAFDAAPAASGSRSR
jgi:phosphotransferase family enzyme